MTKTLILGGTKSGKSHLAEQWAKATSQSVSYIATAQAHDDEMAQRIKQHQQQRPGNWPTIEQPLYLGDAINQATTDVVLVDCLTLWLTNLLLAEGDLLTEQISALLVTLQTTDKHIIMVSNETNMGVMPLGDLTRRYCDEAGVLHQRIAKMSDNVILTVAGLPHILKGQLHEQLR
ncbi:bifunctional adenosylcobinamide kinase/adenosylcobinamide-phosphate guanylyltransferase [Methylophaga thalassica]|uniref:bifunctional adenosylcobinamide kinase/adenosylcobinamide-phosphate guanylyltransferase n=1 Tax=Methylophaga aminisulfidivorans TaxID=230105 RepID=UPI003A8F1D71